LAGSSDLGAVLSLFWGQLRVDDKVGEAENNIQGSPDLVARIGKELALDAVGSLRLLFGYDQFCGSLANAQLQIYTVLANVFFYSLAFRDVAER
jgi:hypothetical protein